MPDGNRTRQPNWPAGDAHQSLDLLDAVLTSMVDGLVVADPQHRFLVFNQEAQRILGTGPDDSAPADWSSHFGLYLGDRTTPIPTDELPLIRALRGERGTMEAYVRHDGATDGVWVDCTYSPVLDADGRVIAAVTVFRDVTRSVEARQALTQSERRLAQAERVAQIGSWEWDVTKDCIVWTDEHFRLMGAEPGAFEPTYRGFIEAIHPQDRAKVEHAVDAALRGFKPYEAEYRVRRPDGTERIFHGMGEVTRDAAGRPTRMLGVTRDVTDQRRAEAALLHRSNELRAIIESTTDSIYIKDLCGRYILANPVAADVIAGMPAAELLGKCDEEVFDADTARRIREADQQVLEHDAAETFELPVVSLRGASGVYLSTKFPFRSPAGELLGLIGIARDITERKRLEETLRTQYEHIRELDRLRTDMVNAVSHDLRTPLTAILGYAELMQDAVAMGETDRLDDYVDQVVRNTRRMERMVEDLLDFARLESRTFALACDRVDFRQVVAEIVESFRPQAQLAHIALRADLPESPLPVAIDVPRMQRVLANLIGNALKFTPEGGLIRVRAATSDHRLRCEVRDTGVGIEPDEQPRLFQRFSQLEAGRRARGGLGLGLWISKALVEAHGGAIGVTSEPGRGSTFWFTLPVVDEAAP